MRTLFLIPLLQSLLLLAMRSAGVDATTVLACALAPVAGLILAIRNPNLT